MFSWCGVSGSLMFTTVNRRAASVCFSVCEKVFLLSCSFPQSKEQLAGLSPNETKWVCLRAAVEQAKCGWSIGFSAPKWEEQVNVKAAVRGLYKDWWGGVWMMKRAAEAGRQSQRELHYLTNSSTTRTYCNKLSINKRIYLVRTRVRSPKTLSSQLIRRRDVVNPHLRRQNQFMFSIFKMIKLSSKWFICCPGFGVAVN